MDNANLGAALAILGGLVHGSFALPMKRMEARWKWENIWLVYSVVGLIFFPVALAWVSVPDLTDVYAGATAGTLAAVVLFGLGWGIGSTLFGLGISRVGMALGFAIILGITSSVGSLLPLIIQSPSELWTRRGAILLLGLALVIAGIIFCSTAGALRDRDRKSAGSAPVKGGFQTGLIICIASGLLSPSLNFAFVFGKPLQDAAQALGARGDLAANAIWAPALAGGFLANAGYAVQLLQKNGTWKVYTSGAPRWFWLGASLMGLMWFAGISLYGMGAAAMGRLGAAVGWPVFMSTVIVTANIWGVVSGEWAGAGSKARGMSWIGLGILVAAIVVISRA